MLPFLKNSYLCIVFVKQDGKKRMNMSFFYKQNEGKCVSFAPVFS